MYEKIAASLLCAVSLSSVTIAAENRKIENLHGDCNFEVNEAGQLIVKSCNLKLQTPSCAPSSTNPSFKMPEPLPPASSGVAPEPVEQEEEAPAEPGEEQGEEVAAPIEEEAAEGEQEDPLDLEGEEEAPMTPPTTTPVAKAAPTKKKVPLPSPKPKAKPMASPEPHDDEGASAEYAALKQQVQAKKSSKTPPKQASAKPGAPRPQQKASKAGSAEIVDEEAIAQAVEAAVEEDLQHGDLGKRIKQNVKQIKQAGKARVTASPVQ